MDGPFHYREAERRLLMAWEEGRDPANSARLVAEAHVHATLALAAATAIQPAGYGTSNPVWKRWEETTREQPEPFYVPGCVSGQVEPEPAVGDKVRLTDLESRLKDGETIRVFHPDWNDGDPVQLRDVMTYGDDIPEGRIGVFYSFTNGEGEDEYVKGLVPVATFVIPYGGGQ